jgi:cytochrome c peroxidase
MMFLLLSLAFAAPSITPPPSGPYHVEGNRILDAAGHPYLVRGTQLPPVTLDPPSDYGPFSGTTFITIRQRLNMNAVRLPVDTRQYESNAAYRARVKELVQQANQFELLVILECASAQPAADFKTNPNLFFSVPDAGLLKTVRSSGATQPIIVPLGSVTDDRKIIYEFSPSFAPGNQPFETQSAPLLANGLDPQLTRAGPECAAFPSDPGAASRLIEDLLTQFDQRSISWTISTLEPGKLIDNYAGYDWSKLDDGWTCGEPYTGAGIGMALLSHLWSADAHGVFTVNQPAGGLVIARGANASAYGRIMAEHEAQSERLPLTLSNISIRVTDSRGVSRLAHLSWTGAGWSSTNLLIPENSAPGPAEVTIVRSDGSKTASRIFIADAAPGLWTATYDGRGPVIGRVSQGASQFPAWDCSKVCRTVPIPLSPGVSTTVRLDGVGFRFASSVRAFVDGVSVPVESFGPNPGGSRDHVIVKLPDQLIGRGEVDLFLIANGTLSNVARINCGELSQVPDLPSAVAVSQAPNPPAPDPAPRPAPAPSPTGPKVRLGRYLFYDKRMSINGSSSCATCHRQDLAFTDGRAQAIGATDQLHPRSAMSLINLAYNTAFNWNDPSVRSLEQQALKPMRSTSPVELGLNEPQFLKLIRADPTYRPLFRQAFPNDPNPYTILNVARAIAAFERTIVSRGSPYDRFHRDGDQTAIPESAKRGEILFFLDGGPSCFRCHSGFNFSDSNYHNNGLGAPGKFKTPSLRNIALTAPYMHDGSISTLEGVIDHYATGGKAGHDPIMRGFRLTPQNRADLVAFLKTLTDETLLHNPLYSNPWP